MPREVELLEALSWRPAPPTPATLEFALLAWDFELETPDYEYEVELPEADFEPMYVDFVSASYAAALNAVGDLKIPGKYGEKPGLLKRFTGLFPGTRRGTEGCELWTLAVAWEFDTWLERILRINGGDVAAARALIEDRCPIPDFVGNTPDLKTELLNYPDDANEPDLRMVLRWMGTRGWNDDRIREIVVENSIMLNDWHNSAFAHQ
ncbi:MAG TPA: hypothetical protein QF694_04900 [Dehalococcoidia bacterium]|jgi:hypothetical protein|nr:hypothetical protein [Chloroflexota bacterium]MDP6056782.1 hypothetical protein [Dehalococcoidia bacterium]MDP7261657.1 hypothetical protein [Dehalococcoidia bacterium]MDP7484917.1 hypothetical protein [Dehalococcoidia bacterium]HJP28130.1 hypothetical protein [Dehalococcoidia bacterium]|tara:strand:+ start:3457 stop:4077 length:621 start_codon:yes stop_codon:yes gene_type:complete